MSYENVSIGISSSFYRTGIEVKKGIGTARDFAIKDRIRNKVVLTHDTFDLKKEVKLIPTSIYLLF